MASKPQNSYVLAYDISDDRKRYKVFSLCKRSGWIMVQKSLYLKVGISEGSLLKFNRALSRIEKDNPNMFDSVILIKLNRNQLEGCSQVGYQFPFETFFGSRPLEFI